MRPLRVLTSLNQALQRSGAQLAVTPASLPTFLEPMAPVILVDGEVAFSRGVPPWFRLREKVEEALATDSA